jgi:enolase
MLKLSLCLYILWSVLIRSQDVAAAEFYDADKHEYNLGKWYPAAEQSAGLRLTGQELAAFYHKLIQDFSCVVTIEDPFDQDDWGSWQSFTASLAGSGCQVVGDDLTVTNVARIQRAVKAKACDCLLLKVNQIGTVTESIAAVKLAKASGWGVMCSHRSGETEDTSIADLSVGLCCGQIKTGAPCRSDRLAKYAGTAHTVAAASSSSSSSSSSSVVHLFHNQSPAA